MKKKPGAKSKTPRRPAGRQKSSSARPPSWPAWLLVFLVASPAIFAPYGQGDGYTPDLHTAAYIQVGATVLVALFFLSSAVLGRAPIIVPYSPLLLPLSLFYGWAVLSVLWADAKYQAAAQALEWSGAFLGGLLVLLILRGARWMRRLLFFILIGGLLTSLLGIGQFLFAVDWVQQHTAPAATFGNKNMAAQYVTLIFPVAAVFFLRSADRRAIWFFAVAASLLTAYIFYAHSRGSLAGFLAEIAVLFCLLAFLKRKRGYRFFENAPVKRIALFASVALFLGAASVTPDMFGNAEEVTQSSLSQHPPELFHKHGGEMLRDILDYQESGAKRFTIWGNSAPMFKDYFLVGVGLGNWTNHYATYQSWFQNDYSLMEGLRHGNAHNDYIEILCELGIIGFALFVWAAASFLRASRRLLSGLDEEGVFIAVPLITALAGVAVNALFSFPFKQPVQVFTVVVYLAVLSNLYATMKEAKKSRVPAISSFPAKIILTGASVLLAASLFDLQRDWHFSKLHQRGAELSMANKDYRKAADEAARAHTLSPLSAAPLQIRAKALLLGGDETSYREAVETLEKIARVYPDSSDTLMNLAAAYYLVGRHEDMVKSLGRLYELQPVNVDVKYRYAFSLLESGKWELALKVFGVYRRHLQFAYERRGRLLPTKTDKATIENFKKRIRKKEEQLAEIDQAVEKARLGIRARGRPGG